jgi:hypothetical protein
VPLVTTAVLLSLNLYFFAVLTIGILELPGKDEVNYAETRLAYLVVVTAIAMTLYSRWILTSRYLQFPKEFGSESAAQSRIRGILLWIYGLGSIVAPILAGYFVGKL